jgi:invasin-like protein
MAMSATLVLSSATTTINKFVTATLTVSNSGAASVNVLNITPMCGNDDAASLALGNCPLDPSTIVTVPPSGSLIFSFNVVPFASSTGLVGLGTGYYAITAQVSTSDGSVFFPTAQDLTVYPLPLPGLPTLYTSQVTISPASVSHSGGTATATLTLLDAGNNPPSSDAYIVAFGLSGGTATGSFGTVTNNQNGTFTSTFTASGSAGSGTSVTATLNGGMVTSTASITTT